MGRKKVERDEDLCFIGCQVSRQEKERIVREAHSKRMTVSDLIRSRIVEDKGTDRPEVEITPLLSVNDISRYLNLSIRAARRLCMNGEIECSRVNGKYMIKQEAVDRFLVERQVMTTERSDYLTTAEAAREATVTIQTITNWIHAGKLKAIRPGGTYRILKSDLHRFLGDEEA